MILLIPFALTYAYGRMVKDQKQGWVIFATMFAPLDRLGGPGHRHGGAAATTSSPRSGASQTVTADQGGGNMEGKEVRFGSAGCGVFAATTTGTSTGAVNCAHDSMTPLGGMAPLVNMMLGEVSPGGVGAGLYGMLIFALLAVFIAGLMVGRTPEYLGKKIQAAEMKLVVLYILAVPAGGARASPAPRWCSARREASILNPGPHGLTEVAYAFTSAGNNNGSAFGGLTGNTDWYNTTLGLSMLVGRFLLIVPALAIAGSLARKQRVPGIVRHLPHRHAAVRRPAHRRRAHRRRPHLLPRPRARPRRRAARPLGAHRGPPQTLDRRAAEPAEPRMPNPEKRVAKRTSLFEPAILKRAVGDSFVKLDPRTMMRNPVMFVVEIGSVLTTLLFFRDLADDGVDHLFVGLVAGVALVHRAVRQLRRGDRRGPGQGPGRHPAQDPLRDRRPGCAPTTARSWRSRSSELALGDLCVVAAGEVIPGDGEIVEGIASVDESAITGESAPVIRESGGDRSAVTGGTRVLSDEIVVRITQKPGEGFIDRMIALVEGAERQKTPNEIALNILLSGLTIIFLLATVTLQPLRHLLRAPSSRSWCWSRCWSASSPRRSAGCCRPSASPAWTAWCSATCWPCPAGPSRRPATCRRCCSTRPAPSPTATAWRPTSSPSTA